MKFQSKDIAYIKQCLKEKGLGYQPLLTELVDHVTCEVETEMKKGIHFKEAVDKVITAIDPDSFIEIQSSTIQSDNLTIQLMLYNTFRMLWRGLLKNKKYSIINLAGMAIGLASFLAIVLYVRHELSYDKFFAKAPNIYRITMSSEVGGKGNHIPTSYAPLGPELKSKFEEVKDYVRIINYKYSRLVPTFQHEDNIHYEDRVILADSNFFSLFDFPLRHGNALTALQKPTSVVLTTAMAQKYFGRTDVLGEHLVFNAKQEMEVTGVVEAMSTPTHLQFDFIIPMAAMEYSGIFRSTRVLENWSTDWFWIYIEVPNDKSITKIEEGINALATEKIPQEQKEYSLKFFTQSLSDIHLYSKFDYNTDISTNGDIRNLYILVAVGILILFVSSINFVNISLAMATKRLKEIGVSKVLGALRSQLRTQFILESISVAMIALAISFVILLLWLPLFSGLLNVPLEFNGADWRLILLSILFASLLGLASGIYPAFFVTSFEPHRVLKGVWKDGSGKAMFRKALVGIQIFISIFLIIGTIIIYSQLKFIQEKPLGYQKEQIVMLTVRGTSIPTRYHTFKNKLLQESSIENVSSVSEPIGREVQFMSFKVGDDPEPKFVKILNVTHDFAKTMGLEVKSGRDFSKDYATDSTEGFVINEAAAQAFGWNDAIGKPLGHSFRPQQGKVIGVLKDFNFEPLQKNIDPIIMFFGGPFWYVSVRTQPGKTVEALHAMEEAWKSVEPDKPFAFQFLDQAIQHVYEKEERLSQAFLVFTLLSIVTAMLGLFGLVSFLLEQRLPEIGVRKVLGASIRDVMVLIMSEYFILMVAAFLLASPVTYWIMNRWLESFAYRVPWSPIHFAGAFIIIGGLVLSAIFWKVLFAAQTDPVKILRNE